MSSGRRLALGVGMNAAVLRTGWWLFGKQAVAVDDGGGDVDELAGGGSEVLEVPHEFFEASGSRAAPSDSVYRKVPSNLIIASTPASP